MSRTYYVVKEPPRVTYGRFFEAVQRRPALWNPDHKHFGNMRITYALWEQVAKITAKRKASSAQLLYLRMRRGYEKFLCGRRDSWNYEREMSFLGRHFILLKKPWPKRKKPRRARGGRAEDFGETDDCSPGGCGADSDDSMSDVMTEDLLSDSDDEEDDEAFDQASATQKPGASSSAPTATKRPRVPSETLKMNEKMRRLHAALKAQQTAVKIARQMARVDLPLVPPRKPKLDWEVKEESLSPEKADSAPHSMCMMDDYPVASDVFWPPPAPSSTPPATATTVSKKSRRASNTPSPKLNFPMGESDLEKVTWITPTLLTRNPAKEVPEKEADKPTAVAAGEEREGEEEKPLLDVQFSAPDAAAPASPAKRPAAAAVPDEPVDAVEAAAAAAPIALATDMMITPVKKRDPKVPEAPRKHRKSASEEEGAGEQQSENLHPFDDSAPLEESHDEEIDVADDDGPSAGADAAPAASADSSLQDQPSTSRAGPSEAAQQPEKPAVFDFTQSYIDFQNEFYHIKDPEVLQRILTELEKLPFAVVEYASSREDAASTSMDAAETDESRSAPSPPTARITRAAAASGAAEKKAEPELAASSSASPAETTEKDLVPKTDLTSDAIFAQELYVSQYGRIVPVAKRAASLPTLPTSQYVYKRKYVRKATLDGGKKEAETKPDTTPTPSNEAEDATVDTVDKDAEPKLAQTPCASVDKTTIECVEKDAEPKPDLPSAPTSTEEESAVGTAQKEDEAKLDCAPAQTPCKKDTEQTPIDSVKKDTELKLGFTPALTRRKFAGKATTDTTENGTEAKLDSAPGPTPTKRKYVRKAVANTAEKGAECKSDSTPGPTPAKRKYVRKVPLKGKDVSSEAAAGAEADSPPLATPSKRPRGRPPLPATLLKRQAAAAAAAAALGGAPLDPSLVDLKTSPLTAKPRTPMITRTSSGRTLIARRPFTPSKPV